MKTILGLALLFFVSASGAARAETDATHANLPTLATTTPHPRLWYGSAARLAQARAFFPANISADADDFYTRALNGLINGKTVDCQAAANYFNGKLVENDPSGFRDAIRGQGEELLLMYDWCHSQFTTAQIHALVDRWNGYLDRELADTSLGNTGDEANNYWAGRVMNALLWGIASYGDTDSNGNMKAQTYIDNSLITRMGTGFPTWYGNFGKGGVFPEGDEYGVVSLAYPLLAFTSAADYGYDEYAMTNYYRESIYALIYGTTPGPSTSSHGPANQYSMMPFNDDELFTSGAPIIGRDYLGDYATLFGTHLPGSGNSKHILAWQAAAHAGRRSIFDALGTTGNTADLATLPLDYYAPGAEVVDMRTSHDPANAMQVHLQLGTPGGTEHRHLDGGSFQVWRKGRWMTRESVGYANSIVGFGNQGTIDVSDAPAHNTLLFEGRNTGIWIGGGPQAGPQSPDDGQPVGLPQVVRLQHADQFAFVATDYSKAYRNVRDSRVDWPYANTAMREFLFVRPLQALIVLDRTSGSSDSQRPYYSTDSWLEDGPHEAAADVLRSFVMHFENAPTIAATGDRVSATIGTQKSELITLVPAKAFDVIFGDAFDGISTVKPSFKIVDERVTHASGDDLDAAQYRLELNVKGSDQSYFLNVITGYDAGEAPLGATVQETASQWTITLTHPTRGNAVITLQKGMTSTGGTVQIGTGAAIPLRADVQSISVTNDGPVWGN